MHPNKQTLETFYSAFARLDAQTMGRCYAQDAVFEDEVFCLNGERDVAGMWRMLCQAVRRQAGETLARFLARDTP